MKRMATTILCLAIGIHLLASQIWNTGMDTLQQRFLLYSLHRSPEKLYLHVDRTYFSAGETIWFKGYLTNASYESIQPPSKYIYVELLRDSVILRVKIKEEGTGFPGHMTLPDTLPSGNYILRAYTRWQMNRNPEYMFYTGIKVQGTDPLPVKNNSPDKKAKSTRSVGNTDQSNRHNLDISFYPEGGRYFAGQKSVIGFKAMEENGNSVNLTGELVDSRGNTLMNISPSHQGMGTFVFVPQKDETYSVKVTRQSGKTETFYLPVPAETGATINTATYAETCYIKAFYIPENDNSVYLLLHNGSQMILLEKLNARKGDTIHTSLKIPESKLVPGINHVLLADRDGKILSERMFFVYQKDTRAVNVHMTFDKPAYRKREKIAVNIRLTDEMGQPAAGNFSVSVVTDAFKEYLQEDNILSYMQLSSELNGHIQNPKYYFNPAVPLKQRIKNMDLLMLIQGWKYYDMPAILTGQTDSILPYNKEFTQCITGRIVNNNAKKITRHSIVILAPAIKYSRINEVKTGGHFVLDHLDFYDNTTFCAIYQEKNKDKFFWDQEVFPDDNNYAFLYHLNKKSPTTKTIKYIPENNTAKEDTLNAIVVQGNSYFYKNTSPNLSPLGQTIFDKRQVKTRKDMEMYDNQNIIDYILCNFTIGNKMVSGFDERIFSIKRTSLWNEANNKPLEPLLYIDGIKQPHTGALKGISVRDVQTLAVLRGTEGALYNCIHGVILIELKKGGNIQRMPPDITQKKNSHIITPLGYQQPVRFYAPVYDTPQEINVVAPDVRNTLYWNPEIKTDTNGKALFDFYTSDDTTQFYQIRIEGVSSNSRYISGAGAVPLFKTP